MTPSPVYYGYRFSFLSQPERVNQGNTGFDIVTCSSPGFESISYLHLAHFYLICKRWELKTDFSLAGNCINLIFWFVLMNASDEERKQLYQGRLDESKMKTSRMSFFIANERKAFTSISAVKADEVNPNTNKPY